MRIKLICIGKKEADLFQEAIQFYQKKLEYYCTFESISIPYLKNIQSLSVEEQKKREGELLLSKINPGDYVILLDEQGKEYGSVAFSEAVQQWLNRGIKTLIFIIGGAYGFSEEIYQRGNEKLSLSKMTFTHLMSRLLFIELLYRAFTLINHEPYHPK